MKKKFVLFSLLIAMFFIESCSDKLAIMPADGYANVKIVLAGSNLREIGEDGLPKELIGENTELIVSDENGEILNPVEKTIDGKIIYTLHVKIGTKIKVKVVVSEALASWVGVAEHEVTSGENAVSVRVSKTPKRFPYIAYDMLRKDTYSEYFVKLPNSSGEIKNVESDDDLSFIRDAKGRLYVSKNQDSLRRYNVDGNKDEEFGASTWGSSISQDVSKWHLDPKVNAIYIKEITECTKILVNTKKVLENNDNSEFWGDLSSLAFYDNTMFSVSESEKKLTLMSYKIVDEQDNKKFKIEENTDSKIELGINFISLVNDSDIKLSDVYADDKNLYILASESVSGNGSYYYSRGALIKVPYDYSKEEFGEAEFFGINQSAKKDAYGLVPVTDEEFYGPQKFVGHDEDGNIFISDDGFKYKVFENNQVKLAENKNRLATFNRDSNKLSFEPAKDNKGELIKWKKEKKVYDPSRQLFLWNKEYNTSTNKNIYKLWLGDTDSSPHLGNEFAIDDDYKYSSFCFDENANIYVLEFPPDSNYSETYNHKIKYFSKNNDGSYNLDTSKTIELEDTEIDSSDPISSTYVNDISVYGNSVYHVKADGNTNRDLEYIHKTNKDKKSIHTVSSGEYSNLAAFQGGLIVLYEGNKLELQKYALSEIIENTSGTGIEPSEKLDISDSITEGWNVKDMQVIVNNLYMLAVKETEDEDYRKVSSKILKFDISDLKNSTPEEFFPESAPDKAYKFVRFVAVKDDKLVIANDGYYGYTEVSSKKAENNNSIVYIDLNSKIIEEEKALNKAITFTSELVVDNANNQFNWK